MIVLSIRAKGSYLSIHVALSISDDFAGYSCLFEYSYINDSS